MENVNSAVCNVVKAKWLYGHIASNDLGILVEEVTKTIIYYEDSYITLEKCPKPNTDDKASF